jgi:hypothetical protein
MKIALRRWQVSAQDLVMIRAFAVPSLTVAARLVWAMQQRVLGRRPIYGLM